MVRAKHAFSFVTMDGCHSCGSESSRKREKIVLSVCNSGLLDCKTNQKRLHFLNMNHADAGHGFHLRLAAQNSKEPNFVKMFS